MKPNKNTAWHHRVSMCSYAAAAILLLAGFLLMYGEGSDFSSFRPEIFSPVRIRLAPLLCLAGYLLMPFGIMSASYGEGDK